MINVTVNEPVPGIGGKPTAEPITGPSPYTSVHSDNLQSKPFSHRDGRTTGRDSGTDFNENGMSQDNHNIIKIKNMDSSCISVREGDPIKNQYTNFEEEPYNKSQLNYQNLVYKNQESQVSSKGSNSIDRPKDSSTTVILSN